MLVLGILFLFFLYKNMEYVSIYSLLWCLLSELCGFLHIDLIHVFLILKYFLFGGINFSGIIILISHSTCSFLIYRKVIQFCILYPTTFIIIIQLFLTMLSGFLHRGLCHLWPKTILFPLFNLVRYLFFLFLGYYISYNFLYDVGKERWRTIVAFFLI